ncbi:hypothetical protein MHK13_01465 [Corynebacterium hadale]|uniref:hypothetical protein n=1 Tax=Corynebacterium hadale TaxID=2026255 RepID=UPI001EF3D12E|nr:hypothetical protein [Corynebacterium hadale]MCG7253411.1 hypothetical protein [Corynebacterium hadale]MCG7255587.1 hypothetical protein [Corynebacterium hadale]MCG7264836.1 hypothetical protein [Corynebacterium hadale]
MKEELRVVPYSYKYPSPLSKKQSRFAWHLLTEIEGSHFDEKLAQYVIAKFAEQNLECRIIIARRNYPDQSVSEWTEWVEVNGNYACSSATVLENYTPVFEVFLGA